MTSLTNAAACEWFAVGTDFASPVLAYMSLRADMYQQKAAEAKKSAARAGNPLAKSAFEEVAKGWLLLAEQMEWNERQRAPLRDEGARD